MGSRNVLPISFQIFHISVPTQIIAITIRLQRAITWQGIPPPGHPHDIHRLSSQGWKGTSWNSGLLEHLPSWLLPKTVVWGGNNTWGILSKVRLAQPWDDWVLEVHPSRIQNIWVTTLFPETSGNVEWKVGDLQWEGPDPHGLLFCATWLGWFLIRRPFAVVSPWQPATHAMSLRWGLLVVALLRTKPGSSAHFYEEVEVDLDAGGAPGNWNGGAECRSCSCMWAHIVCWVICKLNCIRAC